MNTSDDKSSPRPHLHSQGSVIIRRHNSVVLDGTQDEYHERILVVLPRLEEECDAMAEQSRSWKVFTRGCKYLLCCCGLFHRSKNKSKDSVLEKKSQENGHNDRRQYNLTAQYHGNTVGRFLDQFSDMTIFNLDEMINIAIIQGFEWMFQSSFFVLIIVFTLWYCLLVFFFAFLMYLVSPAVCISTEDSSIGNTLALSWTTFSTVGYGHIYPNIVEGNNSCHTTRLICAIEAFMGVIFAGVCGAILYAKMMKVQSIAQIEFSDPMVIRYGRALELSPVVEGDANQKQVSLSYNDRDITSSDDTGSFDQDQFYDPEDLREPTPVLEFRILNKMANRFDGGELRDATVQCTVTKQLNDEPIMKPQSQAIRNLRKRSNRASVNTHKSNTSIMEGSTYEELKLTANVHPLLTHAWILQHELDENSPLLTESAKVNLQENGGRWPIGTTNQDIRNCLVPFEKIFVGFSAVSHSSLTTVYEQTVYNFVDIVIGFEFKKLTYWNKKKNRMMIDKLLLNDVQEQLGGGAEPLLQMGQIS